MLLPPNFLRGTISILVQSSDGPVLAPNQGRMHTGAVDHHQFTCRLSDRRQQVVPVVPGHCTMFNCGHAGVCWPDFYFALAANIWKGGGGGGVLLP